MDHRITITLAQTADEVILQLETDPHSVQGRLMAVATRVMTLLARELTPPPGQQSEDSSCH